MSETIIAKRYADALFQIGQEKATMDQLENELRLIGDVIKQNEEILPFLQHPRINNDKKKQLLDESFQGVSTDVINTLKLLIDRHRVEVIPAITEHFIELVNDAKGIAQATVFSVRELNETEKKELADVFAKKLNKTTLKISNVVDPTILGGVKLKIGNTIYDGTVSGKLERIERNLVSANK
ncbi:F0F1 ATP synthase subunit delta [Aquibacillus sp. 3ASR75-11]|uniref:ATP synthase subunit delta n=1 Tax=Terrihalobacillus insolitus TaxID=2950438 RepID=A0A9X3WT59_9BACI|nr:F0F1 ATP synthase subunit delta [Terrihalobacillus insolitus]MDC3411796.1 F0F1 ATP synthase subunit delta [Terrihalobacillus insolitus]MDC3425025.1 F0F1 ATP synthase subunit delta [Terrihalobacillus insolitus]